MAGRPNSSRRTLIIVATAYVLLCTCYWALQRKLLYLPTKFSADGIEAVADNSGFLPWKNPAGEIIGWQMPAHTNAMVSVLIVHGNAGCALNRDYLAQPIHDAADADVYVLEYPGFGARAGSPSKKSLDAAAEEAFQLLPKNRPRFVIGESIGTGPACELAKNHPDEVAGLALFAPYHNLAAVAQRRVWFLPAYFILLDRYNPEADLKHYHGPVKFVVAGTDEIISPDFGLRLANGYDGPKELQLVQGAHHNEVTAQLPEWWQEVFSFWLKNKS